MAVSSRTRKCQIGAETTAGTAVSATTIWRGVASMEDLTTVTIVQEDVGQYPDQARTYVASEGATINMDSTPATFEQIPYFFEAGIESVTPSGTESPYTYSYTFPTTTAPTIATYTIECGDGEDAERAEYCFVESFEITGAPDDALMMSGVWQGRQVTANSFTSGLSLPSVEEILFNTGSLYIDDSGGTIGSTQVSSSFLEFTLSVTTGWRGIQTADGNLYYTFVKLTKPEVTLSITAEHTSDWDTDGEKGNWRSQSIRLVRLQFSGTSSRQLTIDLAGIWNTFSALEDRDGNSVLTGEMTGHYSSDDSLFCEIEVKNALASLT